MARIASNRTVLLLHDGELKDVQHLIEELGARCVAGVPDNPAEIDTFDLVVVTPRHLPELPGRQVRRRRSRPTAIRMAVIERESRTLGSRIQRTGIDVLVRRPVHPRALRLLLLHQLYRGPERRERRVPVGARVRFRVGLRSREGILADLSPGGCQLITSTPLEIGQTFVLYLKRKGQGRLFTAKARVVRLAPAESPGEATVAAAFVSRSQGARRRIQQVMDAFADGPATLPGLRAPALPAPDVAVEAPDVGAVDEEEGIPEIVLGPELIVADAVDPAPVPEPLDPAAEERRSEARRRFDRRVVALGDQAARVMVGRDLSSGGMRVDAIEGLEPGQRLTVALHAAAGETPLVVSAEVTRDDGPEGVVLAFRGLDEEARNHLAKIVDSLPALDADSAEGSRRVVMSEIVGTE